jgi:Arc/MetJ family transcription regulator
MGAAMRTNIEIDDKLMKQAMKASGAPTKKAVVEEALQTLVRLRAQAGIRKLRGKVKWEGNLEESRAGCAEDMVAQPVWRARKSHDDRGHDGMG